MSREAMQMALEALEGNCTNPSADPEQSQKEDAAITALRQALETEQAMKDAIVGGTGVMLDGKRIDPATIYKQEPVAWANSFDLQNFDMKVRTCPDLHHTVPLYTAPPKKQWVGITDEEIDECEQLAAIRYQRHKYSVRGQIITPTDGLEWHFAQAIEAKLKEKNT